MSKSLVQQQFGANAAAYTTSAVHAAGDSLARIVELVKPQRTWAALDIATGAGHTAAALAPHVASVVASDLTPQMLVQAAKLAASRGIANMTTVAADAEALPFADASFDLVTCRIAPHHFPEVPRFVAEVRRVLREGGVFALVDNVSPDALTTPGFTKAELHDASVTYNTFEKLRDPSHARALMLTEWLEVLDDIGLTVGHREILPKPMAFGDWAERMQVTPETKARLDEMLATASPAFKAFMRPRQEQGGLWFTLDEALIVALKTVA